MSLCDYCHIEHEYLFDIFNPDYSSILFRVCHVCNIKAFLCPTCLHLRDKAEEYVNGYLYIWDQVYDRVTKQVIIIGDQNWGFRINISDDTSYASFFLLFLLSFKIGKTFASPRNKSKRLKEKNYLDRFNKLNVYSHIKDNKVYMGIKPEDGIWTILQCMREKKGIREDDNKDKRTSTVDQSTLQYSWSLACRTQGIPESAVSYELAFLCKFY